MGVIPFDEVYLSQLRLVLRILPSVAREGTFALKGGTAINLFERGLPRLSVDIDLCYPHFTERNEALGAIASSLDTIKSDLTKRLPSINFPKDRPPSLEYKLSCRTPQATAKIEVNTTMRGHVFPLRTMPIHPGAQELLEQYVEMPVISSEELYGGKMCAALDRQHPRDLFDMAPLLLENGFNKPIISGFIICLISHNRPIHELLSPNRYDMREAFDNQFSGMCAIPFTYEDYLETREKLFISLPGILNDSDRAFLLSFKEGNPDWELLDIENAQKLQAILWKLQIIRKLREVSPKKHQNQFEQLKRVLSV
ncbi:MAG: nucleotidyl transferase AbiEii/AbiGii toxin family protein [Syntrophobacterales bacterium]|jgi:hypothetical protein|nr:nucleotidyl transferase AbiEii/AbiGii toxin family protein [Syntrophobacterales bacterium]